MKQPEGRSTSISVLQLEGIHQSEETGDLEVMHVEALRSQEWKWLRD